MGIKLITASEAPNKDVKSRFAGRNKSEVRLRIEGLKVGEALVVDGGQRELQSAIAMVSVVAKADALPTGALVRYRSNGSVVIKRML